MVWSQQRWDAREAYLCGWLDDLELADVVPADDVGADEDDVVRSGAEAGRIALGCGERVRRGGMNRSEAECDEAG